LTIKQLQRIFLSELESTYPKTEIDSFFYMLSEEYLNLKRVDIALNPSLVIDDDRFHKSLNDLVNKKPIQYILGKTSFYGLDFMVNDKVLIPRPETEELVNWILDDLKKTDTTKRTTIIDIGTGSGCIAISIAKNNEALEVSAVDISKEALDIAKQNAQNNKVAVQFIADNILAPKFENYNSKFDIIASNPPYVREAEKQKMHDNVTKNEPHLALFVTDENPLIFYEAIADFGLEKLSKNGLIYFEINQYLGKETVELLQKKGFIKIELKKDIFGVDRMIKAMKSY